MYSTSLWNNAVLNNWIWKSVKRTTDAEQQFYISKAWGPSRPQGREF